MRVFFQFLLVLVVVLSLLPGAVFGQQQEVVFPLAFYGGSTAAPGGLRFGAEVVFLNTAGAARGATITFTAQNGQPLAVGLNGDAAAAAHTVSVPAFGKARLAFNTQSGIDVLWAKVAHDSGLMVSFEYRMFVATAGGEEFFSHAEFAAQLVGRPARLFDAPVQLGPVSGFGQREFIPAVVNPSASTSVTTTLTLYDGQVERGRVVRTVPPLGQIYLLLSQADFIGLVLDGRLEVSSSGDIIVAGVKFLNGRFNSVPLLERNLAPNVNIESPQNSAVIESAALAVPFGGWAFDWAPGSVASMLAKLIRPADGVVLASISVSRTIGRADVAAFYPGNPDAVVSGYSGSIQSPEVGTLNLTVEATDNGGAVASVSRSVTVRRPAVLPEAGEYWGPIDIQGSTPPGAADARSKFYVRVIQTAPNEFAVDRWVVYDFQDQCAGGTPPRTSVGLVDSSAPEPIIRGDFSFSTGCGRKEAYFTSPTKIRLRSESSASCRNSVYPTFAPCQGLVFVGTVTKQ